MQLDGGAAAPRRFWTLVLEFAAADNATSVVFQPSNPKVLCCVVEGVPHEMVPPPRDYMPQLVRFGCDLFAGSRLRGWLKWHFARLRRETGLGQLVFVSPGKETTWEGKLQVRKGDVELEVIRLSE